MISKLRGIVSYIGDKYVILDVSGVGYRLNLTASTLKTATRKEKEVSFWTYLSVRENVMELFGFSEKSELDFFELLIGISGIGPKKAISILSVAPVETIKKALRGRDISYLTQVSGIGKKNAEKIILELKDKFEALVEGEDGLSLREESDALEAIKSLGYSTSEGRDALRKVPPEVTKLNDRIKYALKHLGK
ncbi:MAG: Holliday junction branch migration protein RuvA [Candidatus Vogelbacteria bacterium]|nr:Holliday junction branch migration protein RuvA [Candidatus Vogelbacteria bacterium]